MIAATSLPVPEYVLLVIVASMVGGVLWPEVAKFWSKPEPKDKQIARQQTTIRWLDNKIERLESQLRDAIDSEGDNLKTIEQLEEHAYRLITEPDYLAKQKTLPKHIERFVELPFLSFTTIEA